MIMKSLPIIILICLSQSINAYPIDGYKYTGIERLLYQWRIYQDSAVDSKLKKGAFLMMDDIKLSLVGKDYDWSTPKDKTVQRTVDGIFRSLEPQYSLSVMDISSPDNIRYAEKREDVGYQPGSVGKLAITVALFYELSRVYDNDWDKIHAVLYTKKVKAGPWSIPNHHTVPFYDIKKDKYTKRKIVPTDEFTLYQWLDHMMSVSSNAAASILMREAILIHIMDKRYDCASYGDMDAVFADTDKSILADLSEDIMNCPLRELGIGDDEWRLGGFFTRGAEPYVPRQGGSIGTTRGLMKYMLAMEQGKIVNERVSLEIKRLMYLTDRRIRYASSRTIADDAVYFKSGSLYSFKDEPGFVRKQYAGNKYNYMNSIAIIEKQDSTQKKYMVALMSNVLRKNSVSEHYGLASQIDGLIMNE